MPDYRIDHITLQPLVGGEVLVTVQWFGQRPQKQRLPIDTAITLAADLLGGKQSDG